MLKKFRARVRLNAWEQRRELTDQILEVLHRSGKPMSLQELREATGKGRGPVLQAVRLMYQEGYINSDPPGMKLGDQNMVRVSLSPQTRQKIRRSR